MPPRTFAMPLFAFITIREAPLRSNGFRTTFRANIFLFSHSDAGVPEAVILFLDADGPIAGLISILLVRSPMARLISRLPPFVHFRFSPLNGHMPRSSITARYRHFHKHVNTATHAPHQASRFRRCDARGLLF